MNKETKINDIRSEAARMGWFGFSIAPLIAYIREMVATDCQLEITGLKLRAAGLETRIQQLKGEVALKRSGFNNQRSRIGLWDLIKPIIDRRTIAKLNPVIREFEVQLAITKKEIECVIEEYAAEGSELEKMAEFEHFLAESTAQKSGKINTNVKKEEKGWDVLVE
jgi:hypothetical protein